MEPGPWDGFKLCLDRVHRWPCTYMFKFIVPRHQICSMFRLLAGYEYRTRDSRHGRYICFTAEISMSSSDDVIAVYRSARRIEGLIAL